MPKITLVRNDRNFPFQVEILDAEGDIVDITNSSLTLKVQSYRNSEDNFSISGTIINGTLGLAQFFFTDELVNRSGEYRAEVEIEWTSGKILTVPELVFKILKDLEVG